MSLEHTNPGTKPTKADGKSEFTIERRRLRDPRIDTEPSRSPMDAVARGLIAIGERFSSRPTLRVL